MRDLLVVILFAPFFPQNLFVRTYRTQTDIHNKFHDEGTRKDKEVNEEVGR